MAAAAVIVLLGGCDNQRIVGPGGNGGGTSAGGTTAGPGGGAGTVGDTGGSPSGGGGAVAPTGGTTGGGGGAPVVPTGGTTGVAGATGTGGIGGATATACSNPSAPLTGGELSWPSGMSRQSISIAVTVASVTPTSDPTDGPRAFQEITLASAAGEIWTFRVGMMGLPANLLTAGETVTLDVVFSSGVPLISLARGGRLVIFFYDYHAFMGPFLPNLTKFGVSVTDAGVSCSNESPSCTVSWHSVRVTAGGASQVIAPGSSATLGSLTVVLDRFQQSDCFDPDQAFVMGGWQTP